MAIVYLVTNVHTGEEYVGVTGKPLAARRAGHFYAARAGASTRFAKALMTGGAGSFSWQILRDYLFPEHAVSAEAREIAARNPANNTSSGGVGVRGLKHSAETKAKMRAAQTPERIARASARMKANPIPHEAFVRSGMTRRGKPNLKLRGQPKSDHVKQVAREHALRNESWRRMGRSGPAKQRRPVVCLNDGLEFESASAASRFYGISKSCVIEQCIGTRVKRGRAKQFTYMERRDATSA